MQARGVNIRENRSCIEESDNALVQLVDATDVTVRLVAHGQIVEPAQAQLERRIAVGLWLDAGGNIVPAWEYLGLEIHATQLSGIEGCAVDDLVEARRRRVGDCIYLRCLELRSAVFTAPH